KLTPWSHAAATRLRASPRATAPPNVAHAPNDSADSCSPEEPRRRYCMVVSLPRDPRGAVDGGLQSNARPRYPRPGGTSMRGSMQRLRDLAARLLARPDEIMLSLGAGGELLVARLRALLSLLILAMPLVAAFGGAKSSEVVTGLGLALFVNLMAQTWLALARRQLRYGWL